MPARFAAAALVAVWLVAIAAAAPAAACGAREEACETPLGTYHVMAPAGTGGAPRPTFIYFHGAGGSGATIFDADFAAALVARGYVVIAPNGLQRPDSRFGPGWFFRPESPGLRDELAFTREIIDDAVARHGVDRSRIILTGYSIGGSLVWYLACRDADLAALYTPYAGGFWRPIPTTCDGPIRMLHTHGWRDQTVPLEGRPLRDGAIYQGDIFEGLARWREVNGCDLLRADQFETEGRYWRRRWTSCTAGDLELALWPGGHTPPDAEWAGMAADWVEARFAGEATR
ncbi:alpha/beta hydrolase family esterase [Acuticoccus kandeliae]|uniref:alpha/beta hydrolase family esterase n=1 Tax=Acuticoccus kandeliae TaxID=2073160 RepID=UPI000D3E8760|nr:dienelactone hydrolase family protein [Acuticoccus kandeliae]